MTYTFRPAKRENVPLLIGVAGGTGAGKTYSALLLARGIAGEHHFAGIDTENGRMNHYADLFPELRVAQITAPFRPAKYAEAVEAAVKFLKDVPVANRVVIVDSASHEWAGDGGCLDWHDEIMGSDQAKNMSAWIVPKREHKKMLTALLQVEAHVILCFRAEPKVEAVRRNGKLEIVPKTGPTGLDGWLPISEKMMPYELTASFLLMAEAPGVPRPIKLQEQHRPFVPLDKPIGEESGRLLAEWASGGKKRKRKASPPRAEVEEAAELTAKRDRLLELVEELGAHDSVPAVQKHAEDGDIPWLTRQIAAAEATLAARGSGAGSDQDGARENASPSALTAEAGSTAPAPDDPEDEQGSFFVRQAQEAQARAKSKGRMRA